MRPLTASVFLFIFLCGSLIAQERPAVGCPTIDLKGPSGGWNSGGTATLLAVISPHNPSWKLKYNWHLSGGKILSGHGTSSITIEPPPPTSPLIATVEIAGGPDNSICPRTGSVAVHWDLPPDAKKIATVPASSLANSATAVINIQAALPTASELFIFLGHKNGAAEKELAARETEIKSHFPSAIQDRITINRRVSAVDFLEFWNVPPGATRPNCDECVSNQCPKISVYGPAGVTQRGEKFVFTAQLDGSLPMNLSYRWEVSNGRIAEGQGTLKMSADAEWQEWGATVTATLNVLGLPDACPKSASTSAGVTCMCSSVFIDEFGRLENKALRKRLDNLFAELASHPTNQGYIIIYGTEREMRSRERLIRNHIPVRGFDSSRITIVRAGTHPSGTVFTRLYRVPPGAENPTP